MEEGTKGRSKGEKKEGESKEARKGWKFMKEAERNQHWWNPNKTNYETVFSLTFTHITIILCE